MEQATGGRDAETFNILAEDPYNEGRDRILQEGGEWFFPVGYARNIGGGLQLEDTTNEETIPLSDIGHFQFKDILRKDKLIIQDGS